MVLLPIKIQFWPGAIRIMRFLSSFIIMLKKSCSVSFQEVKALPLFLFLLSLQFRDLYDLSLHRKMSGNMVTFLKWMMKN